MLWLFYPSLKIIHEVKISIIGFKLDKRSISINASMGLVAQTLIKFKAVFILPIIIHYLTKEDIGIFRIITTSAGFITPLVTLNIFDGSGIFLSSDFNKESVSRKYNSLLSSLLYILPISLIISATFLFLFNTTHLYWLLISIFILSSVIFKAFITPYQAYQKSKKIVLINFINEYANAGLTLIMILLVIKNYISLFIPVIIMQLLIAIYLYFDVKKEIPIKYYIDLEFIKKVIKVSLPLLPVYIGEWLLASISIYFLENYYGVEEVGIYSVAFSIASLILILRATLQYFWFSTSTNLLQNNQIDKFVNIYKNVIKIYLTVIVVGIIFYLFFNHLLISILANNYYLAAQTPIIVLALAFGFFVFSSIFNGILYGLGKTKIIFLGYLFSGLCTVLTSWFLVKSLSVLGAALSSLIGYFILCFFLFFMVNKKIHFSLLKILNKHNIIMLLYFVLSVFLAFYIKSDVLKYLYGSMIIIALLATLLITKAINFSLITDIIRKEK